MNLRIALVKKFIAFQVSGWDEGTIEEQRARQARNSRFDQVPAAVRLRPVDANGVPAEWIEPPAAGPGILFYLHGGAYALGSINTHHAFVARLSQACGLRALIIDYRLAPENPYPAALTDALTAYQWLLGQGIDPQRIVFAGDSAGAGLAMAAQVAVRDQKLPRPTATICMSPWSDLTLSGESIQTKASVDPFFKSDTLVKYADYYAGDHERTLPLISPQFADLTGLPPLLIQVGADEVLLDDARQLAENAQKAGVEVNLEIWENLFHVFQMTPFLSEAKQATGRIAEFVSKTIALA